MVSFLHELFFFIPLITSEMWRLFSTLNKCFSGCLDYKDCWVLAFLFLALWRRLVGWCVTFSFFSEIVKESFWVPASSIPFWWHDIVWTVGEGVFQTQAFLDWDSCNLRYTQYIFIYATYRLMIVKARNSELQQIALLVFLEINH